MTAQEFAYWLNGFVELGGNELPPTEPQWKMICEHLALVFDKKTAPLKTTQFVPKETLDDWLRRVAKEEKNPNQFPYQHPPFISPQFEPGLPGIFPQRDLVVTC